MSVLSVLVLEMLSNLLTVYGLLNKTVFVKNVDKPVLGISLERHIMPERDVNPVLRHILKLAVN